jgi:hypothetical protein
MKQMTGKFLESCRVVTGRFRSSKESGFNGAFFIPNDLCGIDLKVLCSDGMGWEHVSVSLPHRCPTWEEMCYVKGLFWDDHEAVMQLHPPKSEYVNFHSTCLHLWRPTRDRIPLPDSELVGPKTDRT